MSKVWVRFKLPFLFMLSIFLEILLSVVVVFLFAAKALEALPDHLKGKMDTPEFWKQVLENKNKSKAAKQATTGVNFPFSRTCMFSKCFVAFYSM